MLVFYCAVHINQKGREVAEGNKHDECIYKRHTDKRRRIGKKNEITRDKDTLSKRSHPNGWIG